MTASPRLPPPSCPGCGSAAHTPVAALPPLAVVRCAGCALHYTATRLADSAPAGVSAPDANAEYYAWYDAALRPTLLARGAAALRRLGAPDGELLDVGAFLGVFVGQACAAGWHARGIEPLAGAVALARQRDLPVARGDLLTLAVPDNTLAVVTLWNVLEQLTDPRAALLRLARWLRPGGQLLVRVPDFASWLAAAPPAFAAEYRRWLFPLELNRQLVHFTEPDLRRLLTESGFTVQQVWDDGLPDPARGTRAERWARAITAWGARRRKLRCAMTLLARKNS